MAKAPAKPKSRAIVAVPQSREEAVRMLGQIGDMRRGIASIKALADAQATTIAAAAEAEIAPVREQLAALENGLQTWCEAHRQALTDGGKVKFAELGTGTVKWRLRAPKVNLRGVKIEVAIEAIKRLGLVRFIRVKEELNKDAMLAEPEIASSIQGVSIASEGEDFVIEPAELKIEGAGS